MINLLPPEEKRELLGEETKRLTTILGLVLLFSLFCLIIILAFLKMYLLIQVDSQKSSIELVKNQTESSEVQVIQEQIENANQKLARINDFYEQKFESVKILEKLIKTIPEEIYLTNLSYSKTSSQVVLAGFAPSRDLLIQFKTNLEVEEEFQEIYFSPSNWIEPIDIDFTGVKIILNDESLE